MKMDSHEATDFYHFPVDETNAVMAYMAKAELMDDLAALKRGAKLFMWLYRAFKNDICDSNDPFGFESCEFADVQQFNAAWKKEVEKWQN